MWVRRDEWDVKVEVVEFMLEIKHSKCRQSSVNWPVESREDCDQDF